VNYLLYVKLLLTLLTAALLSDNAFAQSGRISGNVTEKKSGEEIPGVSVFIMQNERGASTDTDGNYSISNVKTGKYSLRFTFVGYSPVVVNNVEVFTGQTTEINVQMRDGIIESDELIIVAERPIVQRDRTSSVSYISSESIQELPVIDVSDLVKFQPGVVTTSSGGFSFRGGRTREVAYVIDGIPVQDVYSQSGGNTINIELESVQELQVLTGTFDAEVGGAQSGVVNLTTKDPSRRWEFSGLARIGGFFAGDDDIFIDGNNFDPTDTKDFTFTASGPLIKKNDRLGFFISSRYEDRIGHLNGIRRFTIDDGVTFDAFRFWYRNRFSPDDARLIPMDNPVNPDGDPILDSEGNALQLWSGDGAVVPMSWSENFTINPKLLWRVTSRTRVTASSILNFQEGQGFNESKRFAPDGRRISNTDSYTNILSVRQSFSNNLFLNVRGSYKFLKQESAAFDDFNDERHTFFSETDPNTGFFLGGTENGRSIFREDQIIASADLSWQINFSNEIKTGFQFRSNRFVTDSNDIGWVREDNPGELANNVRPQNASEFEFFDEYLDAVRSIKLRKIERADFTTEVTRIEQTPIELALYGQNKLELGNNIVVKTGARFEYYDTGAKTIRNTRQQSEIIGREDNLVSADPKSYLSPRVGISFPISEKGAFRVAYGHFTQMPAYSQMFQNPVNAGTNFGQLSGRVIGNPDLKPERTIKYEMGLQHELMPAMGVDINLFYSNVRNLLGREILSTSDGVEYFRTVNRDFGLIKGGTVAFFARTTGLLNSAAFDITYQDAQGSSSNPNAIADVIVAGRAGEVGDVVIDRNRNPLDWDQSLTLNSSISFGKPGNWNVGLIGQIATGQPFTPDFIDETKDFPENFFDNSESKPLLFNLDLTAEKSFIYAGSEMVLKMQVNNIVNRLNERNVSSISGRANQIVRLPDVQRERSLVNETVGLFSDEQDNLRPSWYSAPRQILLIFQIKI
jgi:hypothetical protein